MRTFLHAADLHVDSPLLSLEEHDGAPMERLRSATRRATEGLVKLALDERVDFVVLAGDVIDSGALYPTALFLRQQFERLAEAKIPIVIALGNHDHAGLTPRSMRLPGNVTVLPSDRATSVTPVPGVIVHGRSYPQQHCSENLARTYPEPAPHLLNIGILHTSLGGSPMHDPYAATTPAELARRGYQYWALGHVHQRGSFDEGGVRIVFPGNLQGRHARETDSKGATLVRYEGDKILELEHRPLDVVRWHHLSIDASTLDGPLVPAVAQRVRSETDRDRAEGRLSAVRVTVEGELPTGAAPLTDEALRHGLRGELVRLSDELWLEKVRFAARPRDKDRDALDELLTRFARDLESADQTPDELARLVGEVSRSLRGGGAGSSRGAGLRDPIEALVESGGVPNHEAVVELLARALQRLRAERS